MEKKETQTGRKKGKFKEQLEKIIRRSERSRNDVISQLKEIFHEDFIQNDSDLKSKEDKLKYALRILTLEVCEEDPIQSWEGATEVR